MSNFIEVGVWRYCGYFQLDTPHMISWPLDQIKDCVLQLVTMVNYVDGHLRFEKSGLECKNYGRWK